jgi:RNA polymerase sigma factor for flagellar operon FliA
MDSLSRAAEPELARREELILEHMGLVRAIARRIQQRLPQHVLLEDLVSVGILGLIQAIDSYDSGHQTRLSTYADYKIRGAILDSLRQQDWASRQDRKRSREIEAAILAAQQRLQRNPTEEEVAAELGIALSQYHEWLADVQPLQITSDDNSQDYENLATLHFDADGDDNLPSSIVERQEMEQILAEEIDKLPQIEGTVLSLYYQRELAPFEIAQVVGLKATRVSQIRWQAVARLRANLGRRLDSKKRRS